MADNNQQSSRGRMSFTQCRYKRLAVQYARIKCEDHPLYPTSAYTTCICGVYSHGIMRKYSMPGPLGAVLGPCTCVSLNGAFARNRIYLEAFFDSYFGGMGPVIGSYRILYCRIGLHVCTI
jgi:hypothetical protein